MLAAVNQIVAKTRGENALAEPIKSQKRIGSTVYEVRVRFNPDAKETMNEKILRLIRNDLYFKSNNAKIKAPQTGRLPERSSA